MIGNGVKNAASFLHKIVSRQLYNGRSSFRSCSSSSSNLSDDTTEPPIPEFVERIGETRDVLKARLVYQSRKRGITESGLLLSTFAKKHLNSFTDSQMKTYDSLINKPSNDWDIYYWATGAKPTPPEYDTDVMALLKEHACNDDREQRIRQPDLYS